MYWVNEPIVAAWFLHFAEDRIPPPPIKYVPGTGAVIARVYIMYEAGGLSPNVFS